MAFAYALDPTTPADGENAKLGAGRIRDLKSAVLERLNSFFVDADTDPLVIDTPASGGNSRTILPTADNTYVSGSAVLRWADLRSVLATFTTVVATSISGTTATYTSFVGTLTGNASSATILQTARTINGVAFDGSANIVVSAGTVGTLTFGTHLTSGDPSFGGSNATISSDATDAATASTIVARDASKGFTAGTIVPDADNTRTLGSAILRYSTIYSVALNASTLTTSGAINSQTISATANFTGTVTIGTGLVVSAGTTAVQALTATDMSVTKASTLSILLTRSGLASGTVYHQFSNTADRWAVGIGIVTANAYELYNNALATVAISVAVATNIVTFGANIIAPTGTFSGDILVGAAANIGWSGRSQMLSPSNGVITLYNNAVTDFTRLQFGGTSSSFPSLKRSSAALHCQLADDSGLAAFSALSILTGNTDGGSTARAWKFGDVSITGDVACNRFLTVTVNGTDYTILART